MSADEATAGAHSLEDYTHWLAEQGVLKPADANDGRDAATLVADFQQSAVNGQGRRTEAREADHPLVHLRLAAADVHDRTGPVYVNPRYIVRGYPHPRGGSELHLIDGTCLYVHEELTNPGRHQQ